MCFDKEQSKSSNSGLAASTINQKVLGAYVQVYIIRYRVHSKSISPPLPSGRRSRFLRNRNLSLTYSKTPFELHPISANLDSHLSRRWRSIPSQLVLAPRRIKLSTRTGSNSPIQVSVFFNLRFSNSIYRALRASLVLVYMSRRR